VVANNLRPIVDQIDVGLRPDPWHGKGIAYGWRSEIPYSDIGLPACEWLPANVNAGNVDSSCVVRAIVARLCNVAEMSYLESDLTEEAGRRDMRVVQAGAVGILSAGTLKSATRRTA
jgi:hypothetical protein